MSLEAKRPILSPIPIYTGVHLKRKKKFKSIKRLHVFKEWLKKGKGQAFYLNTERN